MLLAPVMDGLAALLVAGPLDNVYAWPAESIEVPCGVIGYPELVTFDLVYQRGADGFDIPVWYVVGKTADAQARDRLSVALSDVNSVKALLDGPHTFGTAACTVRVTDARVAEITAEGITYIGIKFSTEVVG
jgi:hypothetical protein